MYKYPSIKNLVVDYGWCPLLTTDLSAQEYSSLLDGFGMWASMSRKGNCYDNAPMESFWEVLKNEQIHHCRYATRKEAIQDITEYIEVFYNRQRKQARLGFLSPVAFERWFYEKRLAA